MKNQLNTLALGGVLIATGFLIGCGGDDGGSSSVVATTSAGASGALAPASVAGQQVRLVSGQGGQAPQTVTFGTDGSFTEDHGTNTSSGTFTYDRTANNKATVTLTENGTGTMTTVQLTFNSASSGTYSFNTSTGETGNGSFALTTTPSTGGASGGSTSGGGTTTGGGTGGTSTGGTSTGGTSTGGTSTGGTSTGGTSTGGTSTGGSGTGGSSTGGSTGGMTGGTNGGATGGTTAGSPPAPSTVTVQIVNFAFQPSTAKINVGDTVSWQQEDSTVHTATSDSGVWDSGLLNQNQKFSFTFKAAGSFAYHCTVHSFMKGSVDVAAASAGSAGGTGAAPDRPGEIISGGGATAGAPASLAGRTLVVTAGARKSSGANLSLVQFDTATSFTNPESSGTGTYQYTASGARANVLLNYTSGSRDTAGSEVVLNITFTSPDGGTFTGSSRTGSGASQNFSGTVGLQ